MIHELFVTFINIIPRFVSNIILNLLTYVRRIPCPDAEFGCKGKTWHRDCLCAECSKELEDMGKASKKAQAEWEKINGKLQ